MSDDAIVWFVIGAIAGGLGALGVEWACIAWAEWQARRR